MSLFPNPFKPSVNIAWTGLEAGITTVEIYDSQGREVKIFHETERRWVAWNAAGFPAGIYFAKIMNGRSILTKRLALIK